jgi:hypothetical protein
VIDRAVVQSTLRTLRQFGEHRLEGLVLWLGKIEPGKAHVIRAFTPDQHPVSDDGGGRAGNPGLSADAVTRFLYVFLYLASRGWRLNPLC